jgi:predicted nucleic acid-binding protein
VILVDTSVVIDYTRGQDAKLVALLPTLSVAACGVVRAELLSGARDSSHRVTIASLLAAFQHVPIPEWIWDRVGDNLASLRTRGLTVPLPDVVIGTLGIENDIEVWARDAHFPSMQKVLQRLRLFQEPP